MLIQFEPSMNISKCVFAPFACSSTLAEPYSHIRSQKENSIISFYLVAGSGKQKKEKISEGQKFSGNLSYM